MLRVYLEDWKGGFELPPLPADELHHLVRVRRVRAGEGVQVLNGRGHLGRGRVVTLEGADVRIELDAVQVVDAGQPEVVLLVGMPKGKVFPSLLHRAVELGASAIVPLVTDHSEVTSERGSGKLERWQAVLVEAIKQCGNPHLPRLYEPLSVEAALELTADAKRLVLALVADAVPLRNLAAKATQGPSPIALFVGPEGDFSEKEYARFRSADCELASLGSLVLKVETAAVVGLGLLKFCPPLPRY